MLDLLFVWLFLAFAVERMVEYTLKLFPIIDKKKISGIDTGMLISLIYAIPIAIFVRLDFFSLLDIKANAPLLGYIIAAFFMAGGTEAVHTIINWMKNNKELVKSVKSVSGGLGDVNIDVISAHKAESTPQENVKIQE